MYIMSLFKRKITQQPGPVSAEAPPLLISNPELAAESAHDRVKELGARAVADVAHVATHRSQEIYKRLEDEGVVITPLGLAAGEDGEQFEIADRIDPGARPQDVRMLVTYSSNEAEPVRVVPVLEEARWRGDRGGFVYIGTDTDTRRRIESLVEAAAGNDNSVERQAAETELSNILEGLPPEEVRGLSLRFGSDGSWSVTKPSSL